MDFTSSLYLGLRHSWEDLNPWKSLTSGKPAALSAPPQAGSLARQLARLQGGQAGLLFPSTLHLFWDLFGYWKQHPVAIFLDREAYPILKWGVQRPMPGQTPVFTFRHHDPRDLHRMLRAHLGDRLPIVVTDGWCSLCGRAAPLREYLRLIRPFRGWLVLDDTQAFGVLGRAPDREQPFGRGGGGIRPYLGLDAQTNILTGISLAKGFGVPVAVLSGPDSVLNHLQRDSRTRLHCSPPSAADLAAVHRALLLNRQHGEWVRSSLLHRIIAFRREMQHGGITPLGGLFPVQHLSGGHYPGASMLRLHQELQRQQIHTIMTRDHRNRPQLSFLFRSDHTLAEVVRTGRSVSHLLCLQRSYC